MCSQRTYCLSIAGFDPSGGAGIMADTKVFESHKTYGLGVVSSVTYQNDLVFEGVKWLSNLEIINQIKALIKYPVKAIKIGLIKDFSQLKVIAAFLKESFPDAFIIWDPVLKTGTGHIIHKQKSIPEDLANCIDLITPNFDEYVQLSLDSTEISCSILLKGGHRIEKLGIDTLITKDGVYDIFGEVFKDKHDKHGTGCVLSAAIAANIANGELLPEACRKAKLCTEEFINSNNGRLGYHII